MDSVKRCDRDSDRDRHYKRWNETMYWDAMTYRQGVHSCRHL